jgi:hypothetical protein
LLLILISAQFQIRTHPTEHQLKYWFDRFIPSARTAFTWARNPQVYEARRLDASLDTLHDKKLSASRFAVDFACPVQAFDELPHHIFAHYPDAPDELTATCQIATRYLADKVITKLDELTDDNRYDLYRTYLSVLPLKVAAGSCLEILFHQDVQTRHSWKLREMQSSTMRSMVRYTFDADEEPSHHLVLKVCGTLGVCPNPPPSYEAGKLDVHHYNHEQLRSRQDLKPNVLYIPTARNESTLDSFFYNGESAILFQITVASDHGIKASGIDFIRTVLDINTVTYIAVIPLLGSPPRHSPKFLINKKLHSQYNDIQYYALQYSR